MIKNFRIQLRSGIYFPIALLMCCAAASQAIAYQTESKAVESDKPATSEQAPVETAEPASEPTETDESDTPKSIQVQLKQLAADYEAAMLEWKEEI